MKGTNNMKVNAVRYFIFNIYENDSGGNLIKLLVTGKVLPLLVSVDISPLISTSWSGERRW